MLPDIGQSDKNRTITMSKECKSQYLTYTFCFLIYTCLNINCIFPKNWQNRKHEKVRNIAIFASGTGSNAKKIVEYFEKNDQIQVVLIASNRAKAPVLQMAKDFGIDTLKLDRTTFYQTESILGQLQQYKVDFIVLAGFLWLVPNYLVKAYDKRMVNIHPALLPKYSGKGMYGINVHQAVKDAGDEESGITIHLVNEQYDEGSIVFQARCTIDAGDTPTDIAKKVLKLEHRHFAPVIEDLVSAS